MNDGEGSIRRRPILVTGSHRSGSTWVGRLLAAADELHYVQEPFNIVARQRWLSPRPPHQFLYLTEANGDEWETPLRRVLDLRYPLLDHLRQRPGQATARRMTRIALDARRARRHNAAALVKDPIALFSTPWLCHRFNMAAVVLVRDPVSFVGSLKARQWTFDFRHWTSQPNLMVDLLADHAASIEAMVREPGDIIEQGIVQWNAFYDVVHRFRAADPGLIVARYEDLARDPLVEIEGLYERLDLHFGRNQRAEVENLTRGSATGSSAIDVRRDSSEALVTWQSRLDDAEIQRIQAGTEAIAALFR